MNDKNQGVYFLANDRVFDLTIAFLNSFRTYNPDIPLCMIPFDESIQRLEKLQQDYNFTIYHNKAAYQICDEISLCFHNIRWGHYRKFAMWEGPFEEFIYIDVDTIVLRNIDFVFKFLSEYEFITSHSNVPNIVKFIWKRSIYNTGQLTDEQVSFAANTGFIASKKRALTLENIKSKVESAVALSSHMTLFCKEQPFLNYLIVTSGNRYTSLLVLARKGIYPEIMLEYWAGQKGGKTTDGQVVFPKYLVPILLMHWAGEWRPRRLDRIVFLILRILRIKKKGEEPIPRFFMPYKKLWRYYRFMRKNSCILRRNPLCE